MDKHGFRGWVSVVAFWDDTDTGSTHHLGFLQRDAQATGLVANFDIGNGADVPPSLRISLVMPTINGKKSYITPSSTYRPPHLGPIVIRSHGGCRLPKTPTHTPAFISEEPERHRLGSGAKEAVFLVRSPPPTMFGERPDPRFLDRAEVQRHLRLMRSLSRARRVRLFLPLNAALPDLDLDLFAQRFNDAVPVMSGQAARAGATGDVAEAAAAEAEAEAKWKDYGVAVDAGAAGAGGGGGVVEETRSAVGDGKKRERLADRADELMDETAAGRAPKRVRFDLEPRVSSMQMNNGSSSGALTVHPERSTDVKADDAAETTTAFIAKRNTDPDAFGSGGAAFKRIAPTSDLANRWAEWWQFMYGALGADTTDQGFVDSMWRMRQAVKDDDAAGFVVGVVDSAMYSLDVDKAGEKATTD